MSEAINDPVAYTRLTDNIIQRVLESTDPKLDEVCVCVGGGGVYKL